MNKLFVLIILAVLLCGCGKQVSSVDTQGLLQESIKVATAQKIKFEAQDVMKDNKRKVVMWLNNPTNKGFSGTIQVYIIDGEQQVLHVETIPLDKMAAKSGTWRIFWVKPEYLRGSTVEFKWTAFKLDN